MAARSPDNAPSAAQRAAFAALFLWKIMTDQTYNVLTSGIPKKLKDMGDGTYAEVIYIGNIAATPLLGISDTLWVDDTGASPAYYVRREVDNTGTITVSWENPDGTAASPTIANLKLAALAAKQKVSIADGDDAAQGAKADAAATDSTSAWSVVALLKGVWAKLAGTLSVTQTGAGYSASGKTAVAATFGAVAQSVALSPAAGRGFNISLWGSFSATVQLERSFDGGTTWLPITANGTQLEKFTGPVSEQWQDDEVGVQYRLNCTSWSSGTVNYRISQ
jgi:hypothetical protein